jgi:hypothetical protein
VAQHRRQALEGVLAMQLGRVDQRREHVADAGTVLNSIKQRDGTNSAGITIADAVDSREFAASTRLRADVDRALLARDWAAALPVRRAPAMKSRTTPPDQDSRAKRHPQSAPSFQRTLLRK